MTRADIPRNTLPPVINLDIDLTILYYKTRHSTDRRSKGRLSDHFPQGRLSIETLRHWSTISTILIQIDISLWINIWLWSWPYLLTVNITSTNHVHQTQQGYQLGSTSIYIQATTAHAIIPLSHTWLIWGSSISALARIHFDTEIISLCCSYPLTSTSTWGSSGRLTSTFLSFQRIQTSDHLTSRTPMPPQLPATDHSTSTVHPVIGPLLTSWDQEIRLLYWLHILDLFYNPYRWPCSNDQNSRLYHPGT